MYYIICAHTHRDIYIYIQRINVCIIVESMKECWLASLEGCNLFGGTWSPWEPNLAQMQQPSPATQGPCKASLRASHVANPRSRWTTTSMNMIMNPWCFTSPWVLWPSYVPASIYRVCKRWQPRVLQAVLAFLSTGCIAPNSPVGRLLSRDFWAHTVCENMIK